jgi:3-deoxy-D-manno-octulosonate 8-phosphate phosphatase (KDO 8-P phosphatase)
MKKRLAAIRLLILDVDGTLTEGTVWLGASDDIKGFNIADGLGITLLKMAGIEVAIITGRRSGAVTRRAKELGITHVFQQVGDKGQCVEILKRRLNLDQAAVASMGDDLPDLMVFSRCGLNAAVADAAPELQAAADLVTSKAGGRGAARELAELILKARGEWDAILDRFKNM